jgi:hypothetical protein
MKRAALAVMVAACSQNGTLSVSLVTAPGSTVLDDVQTLQLTLTSPLTTQVATREGSGFSIVLQVDTTDGAGELIVEGLDGSGNLVAAGQSPPFPVDALDATFAIFMAAPNTMAASPAALDPPLDEMAVGSLSFGALFAGGRDASLAPSAAVTIYDGFDHTVTQGTPLPDARAGVAMGIASGVYAYMFGGTDASGSAQANDWLFDTSESSTGIFSDFGAKPGFERANQSLLQVDADDFLLTGTPAAELSDLTGIPAARGDVTSLPASGAVTTGSDGNIEAIFVDGSGVTRYQDAIDKVDTLAAPGVARDGATVIALPSGLVGVFCGGSDAAVIDAVTGDVTPIANVPSDDRVSGCAVAVNSSFVVIAGGTLGSGGVATTAEIYDASTFTLIATTPLVVPRTDATALALPNDQILVAGGDDQNGAPIATIELFTPLPTIPQP